MKWLETRNKLSEAFSKAIKKNDKWWNELSFLIEDIAVQSSKTRLFDFIFYRKNEQLAALDIRIDGEPFNYQLSSFLRADINVMFFAVFDGGSFKVFNKSTGDVSHAESVEEFLQLITYTMSDIEAEPLKLKIADIISEEANNFFGYYPAVLKLLSQKNVRDHLIYSESGQYFHFSNDNRDLNNFENRFFQMLLEELKSGEKIYRYTTLETVFATINHQSLRMNGLVGMNDISEVGYVEDYIDGKSYQPFWDDGTAHQTIQAINRRFILCGSELEDDLNQWRLYGDDCQGACLAFSVKQGQKLPGMQLRKVSYGQKVDGKNYHKELEFLKVVIRRVKSELKQSLRFRTLDIWKHFFKSYEYASEAEVRLLVIVSRNEMIKGEEPDGENPHTMQTEWNLTASHKILNPFITINLDDHALPIRLKEIWLGSKTPERYINKKQFEELLRSRGINYTGNHNVTVRLSGVSNYR